MPPVATQFRDLLRNEGYRPTAERSENGASAITFKSEGTSFILITEEDDPAFFHVVLVYNLDDPTTIPWAFNRANTVNSDVKGVKVTLRPELRDVSFHVELFLSGPLASEILERSIEALRVAAKAFFETEQPANERRLDS
jgi:hypothetical protein